MLFVFPKNEHSFVPKLIALLHPFYYPVLKSPLYNNLYSNLGLHYHSMDKKTIQYDNCMANNITLLCLAAV